MPPAPAPSSSVHTSAPASSCVEEEDGEEEEEEEEEEATAVMSDDEAFIRSLGLGSNKEGLIGDFSL